MSGLAHFLEDEGIATVVLALVRLHAEKMRPPRALAVPFPLGRPLGHPDDAALQSRVLRAALDVLNDSTRPGAIEDFPDVEPERDDPNWSPPPTDTGTGLENEVAAIGPVYDAAQQDTGRTTVGVSRMRLSHAAAYVARFDDSAPVANPHRDVADLAMLRFAADDLKAAYLEAAAHGGTPSAEQLNGWLWRDTALSTVLRALRAASREHPDKNRRAIGGSSLVPRRFAPPAA